MVAAKPMKIISKLKKIVREIVQISVYFLKNRVCAWLTLRDITTILHQNRAQCLSMVAVWGTETTLKLSKTVKPSAHDMYGHSTQATRTKTQILTGAMIL